MQEGVALLRGVVAHLLLRIQPAGAGDDLPVPRSDLEGGRQEGAFVEGAGGVEEGPHVDLGDLAQPLAGGAHPRRHVEREGVGVPHVGGAGAGEEQAQEGGDVRAGAHRGAGPPPRGRWSTMTTAERCSITSTAGRPYLGRKERTKAGRVSLYCRRASAAMVSKTSDDFPEPETPVTTVSLRLGISTSTPARLCSRAPMNFESVRSYPKLYH